LAPHGRQDGESLKLVLKRARDEPLGKVGRPEGTKKEGTNNVDNVNISQGGNSRGYLLRRLARDEPALLDKIKSGEMSTHRAAITAGIIKVPTPLVTPAARRRHNPA
jgi:hypothetical protein